MRNKLVAILAASLLMLPSIASALALSKDGLTRYHISVPERSDPAVDTAARALAHNLSNVTGAEFRVADQSPAIRLQLASKPLAGGPEAFRIARDADDIVITGNSPRAVLYGSYRFLEDYAGVH